MFFKFSRISAVILSLFVSGSAGAFLSNFAFWNGIRVTSVVPAYSVTGNTINVNGIGFRSGATVNVGGTNCSTSTYVSATKMTCVLPANSSVGTAIVKVSNPGGAFGTLPNGFSFLGNPVLWLRSDTIGASNGASVSSWTDLSTATHNFSQATAGNQPTYVTNSLNGYPVVQFNGSNQYMRSTLFDVGGDAGVSSVIVYRWTSLVTGPTAVFAWQSNASTDCAYGYKMMNGNKNFGYTITAANTSNETNLSPNAADTNWHLHALTYTSGTINAYQDGPTSPTITSSAQTGAIHATAGGAFLGAYYINGSPGIEAAIQVAELLVFGTLIAEADRKTIECYLSKKYGLTRAGGC